MRRLSAIFAAFAVSSALAVTPALAAHSDGVSRGPAKDTQTLGGANTTIPNSGAGKSEAGDSQVKRGGLKNTSEPASMSASDMADLKIANVTDLKVVNTSDLATSDTTTATGAPTNTTPAEQQQIQSALEANPKIMQQLKAQSVEVSQVVAANYDGNGTLTVYTK